jgi:hypothetical protein
MDKRFVTVFQDEDTGELFGWPDCIVPGCPHQCCRAENSMYCWPHNQMHKQGYTITEIMARPLPAPPDRKE